MVDFKEQVVNKAEADHFCHWTQHVTLGPPFLVPEQSRVFISGTGGRTFPHGYEGKAPLESSQNFRWPHASSTTGELVDLRQPLIRTGRRFAAVLMDSRRKQEYIVVLNAQEQLLVGYCFARRDFPWTAIWEENKARTEAPWRGKTQARGLEFGLIPFPVGRREAFRNRPSFGIPHFSVIPARGCQIVHYVSFLSTHWRVALLGPLPLSNGRACS